MPITARAARPDDAALLANLWIRSYWGIGTQAEVEERFRAARVFPVETVKIFERDGAVVGVGRTIPFRGYIGGVECAVGGLASVAVAPEARRTGVASAIVREHLAALAADRTPWAMLYGYAPRFYARFGWAPVAARLRWRVRPDALPAFAERAAVVHLSLSSETDLAAVEAVYGRHCPRQNGSLLRGPGYLRQWWQADRKFAVGVRGEDGLSGYALYRYINWTERPTILEVAEWIALDGCAERAILGFFAVQGEQADAVLLDTPVDHPLPFLLDKGVPEQQTPEMPGEHHALGAAYLGLQARIIDLAAALAARGYPPGARARVAFSAIDPDLPANEAPQTLIVDGAGAGRVEPGRGAGAPLVRGPIGALTQVLVGAVRLEAALRLRLVEVDGDAAGLDALLALPPPYPLVIF
ncbi:MAG TPA: GNAT family N-acetyltransferase [Haliangiales bacterium]|nr:GNAT family N-acetyltransferase [Haliangiales bacterium]